MRLPKVRKASWAISREVYNHTVLCHLVFTYFLMPTNVLFVIYEQFVVNNELSSKKQQNNDYRIK